MVHLFGIGSPFGADAIGLLLIDELNRSGCLRPHLGHMLSLHRLDRPGTALLAELEGRDSVVIIDAVMTGGRVGQLHRWTASTMIEECSVPASSHGVGLGRTLALGRVLGVLPPQLLILGVEIPPPDAADSLDWPSRDGLDALVRAVGAELLSFLSRLG